MLLSARDLARQLQTMTHGEVRCVVGTTPVVLFAGTRTWRDFLVDDLNVSPRRWPPGRGGGSGAVHAGFAERTRRLFDAEVRDFVDRHDRRIVLAGHSLGGGCAILMASLLVDLGAEVDRVVTIGVPRLATPRFQKFYKSQSLWTRTTNYRTPRDVVTRLPSSTAAWGVTGISCPTRTDHGSSTTWRRTSPP